MCISSPIQQVDRSPSCVLNKLAVDPAALDQDVQHAIEDTDVAAGTNWNKQVRIARNRRHARIEDDQLAAILASLPQVVSGDRRTFGDVRSRRRMTLAFGMSLHGLALRSMPKTFFDAAPAETMQSRPL